MSSKKLMTKEQYLQAQDQVLDEAMEGDLCQIKVYPAQNRELWLMNKAYKTIGLIHRWLFFSAYLKPEQMPEERVFSVYTFVTLLQKAVRHKGAERNIVELLLLENGHLAACIKCSSHRSAQILEGKVRYQQDKLKREAELSNSVSLLTRCFERSQ